MPVHVHQIERNTNSDGTWIADILRHVPNSIDILAMSDNSHQFNTIALPMVRAIMRDRKCNRIPKVLGLVAHKENEWGHHVQIEVEYDTNGWQAIYAATYPNLNNVSCYAD